MNGALTLLGICLILVQAVYADDSISTQTRHEVQLIEEELASRGVPLSSTEKKFFKRYVKAYLTAEDLVEKKRMGISRGQVNRYKDSLYKMFEAYMGLIDPKFNKKHESTMHKSASKAVGKVWLSNAEIYLMGANVRDQINSPESAHPMQPKSMLALAAFFERRMQNGHEDRRRVLSALQKELSFQNRVYLDETIFKKMAKKIPARGTNVRAAFVESTAGLFVASMLIHLVSGEMPDIRVSVATFAILNVMFMVDRWYSIDDMPQRLRQVTKELREVIRQSMGQPLFCQRAFTQ